MTKNYQRVVIVFLSLMFLIPYAQTTYAQTTGKIIGKITDAQTGEPLPGANVVVEGTNRGAAADMDGNFFILNLPPGDYTLKAQMIGYESVKMENLKISVNRTTNASIKLKQTVIQGQEVVVQAEKVAIKKDQTSTIRNVSSDQIDILPVENVGAVVSMQAGVVQGHFRGGRYNEVAYLVDGLQVTESFGGAGRTVDLEPEAIQDLEVITGTFNAEYGRAMSGVVNAVTKDGSSSFHGLVEGYLADYVTPHSDIFIGLANHELNRNQDYKFQLSGPVFKNSFTFFSNLRYQDNKNHLYGIRRFNVNDYSYFLSDNPEDYYSEHTGDSALVAMNRSRNLSFMGKLTAKLSPSFRMSLLYTHNNDEWHNYDHAFKYNPDGMGHSERKTDMVSFEINHMLSPRLFYEFKTSAINNYNGWYVYKNPFDSRYVSDRFFVNAGPGFFTGGQQKGHDERTLKDVNIKYDLTWQVHRNHGLKMGALYTHHDLDNQSVQIRNAFEGQPNEITDYKPVIYPDSSIYSDIYHVKPVEFSAYFQDKMEFDEMVINAGVRYDYFNPETFYPSQRRNPSNQLLFENDSNKMSRDLKATAKYQISPRFGLSYQLGQAALLHFSYGHFFQMPPMYAMYQNHAFRVAPNDYATTMGNSMIRAQKTVQYEVGLWQELTTGMGLEVSLFYRDIYDLLSAKVISTFNQIEYGLYSNKDYGNAKGLEVKYDFVAGRFSTFVNYTLQYTRGNADNPTQTFTRAGESMDPIDRLIPMSWDQRHTLNVTAGYNAPQYGITLTGYYNSGTPYTWSPIPESILSRMNLYPNNNWKPSTISVDLTSFYDIRLAGNMKLRFTLSVYNLFDRLNEVWVNNQTGHAYTAIIRPTDLASHRSNFNDYEDRIKNPSMYSAPRLVKLGMGLTF